MTPQATHRTPLCRIINSDFPMARTAAKLARHGYHVFPTHVPIHDENGKCTGCTCEHYRRSDQCKINHPKLYLGPNGKCPKPGKCPAVKWRDKSTTDQVQILKWWGGRCWQSVNVETGEKVYYIPNIAIDCGKSNILVFDADKYKQDYAGENFLSREDEQTVTVLTGGGGEHYYYDRQGLPYGNDTGNLPDGVDIRGDGGYVMGDGSLHESTRRHGFEEGYSPDDIKPRPIPPKLIKILQEAHEKKSAYKAAGITVNFSEVTGKAPDLNQWDLDFFTLDGIENPAPVGQRSEHDFAVVIGLCRAELTDDQIRDIFYHYPIGRNGKFAERGLDYLARTITNARAELAKDEQEREQRRQTLQAARLWVRTTSFAPFIPNELKGKHYRTDSTDTKVADAVLDLLGNTFTVEARKQIIAKHAGVSANSVVNALERLKGWLFDVEKTDRGLKVTLRDDFCLSHFDTLKGHESVIICQSATSNEYSPRKAWDAFSTGVSRYFKTLCIEFSAKVGGTVQEYIEALPKGLGETSLRVLDALGRCGEMTVQELAEETGKAQGGIRQACRVLVSHDLLTFTQESSRASKVYELADDVWEKVKALTPILRTYKKRAERENKSLESAQIKTQHDMRVARDRGDAVAELKAQKRFTWLGFQRVPLLRFLYKEQGLPDEVIKDLAYKVYRTGPHPSQVNRLAQMHAKARMDVAEMKRKEAWDLVSELSRLRNDGMSKKDAARALGFAGYTPNEIWQAANVIWPKRQAVAA
jgi:DNA-binding transcriptional ArsR family regulator